jgi:hypothetical protein
MEHIVQMKLMSYEVFFSRMIKHIDHACQKSNETIQFIPPNAQGRWKKERLPQRAELKHQDHVNAKDCKFSNSKCIYAVANIGEGIASQINDSVTRLLKETHNTLGMTRALWR